MPNNIIKVRITQQAFDPGVEISAFHAGHQGAGALASFTGYCRDMTKGNAVSELVIEQYPGFTEKEIVRLAQAVSHQLGTLDLMVVHRVGSVRPGEAIVLVAALSAHRSAAFDAVRLMMDYLKTDAPLWKKESGPDGARWIEPSDHDHARRAQAKEKSGEKV